MDVAARFELYDWGLERVVSVHTLGSEMFAQGGLFM